MSGQKLSTADAMRLGEERESWCAVERQKESDWCRKERKHDKNLFTSVVFQNHVSEEPRCTFQVNAPTHRERKHFNQQYSCQWKV